MNRMEKILRGLQILQKYPNCDITSEHDQIWVGPNEATEVSIEDAKELELLGFFIDEDSDTWSHFI